MSRGMLTEPTYAEREGLEHEHEYEHEHEQEPVEEENHEAREQEYEPQEEEELPSLLSAQQLSAVHHHLRAPEPEPEPEPLASQAAWGSLRAEDDRAESPPLPERPPPRLSSMALQAGLSAVKMFGGTSPTESVPQATPASALRRGGFNKTQSQMTPRHEQSVRSPTRSQPPPPSPSINAGQLGASWRGSIASRVGA